MLHSGVLKKFGLYGLLRVAVPLLPVGMQHWMFIFTILLIGNIIYVGFVTIAQKRLDTMLGYSSVMHMGYIFLGITSFNAIGLTGAATLMFAHGLSIAVLFAVAGEVRARTGTMRLDELGGLATSMPFLTLAFGLAMFASIGLPGFANFASELMVFFGAFASGGSSLQKFNYHQVAVVCGLWGVVMSAVYMLRAFRRVFLGPPKTAPTHATVESSVAAPMAVGDLLGSQRWALAILLVGLVVVGFRPSILINLVRPVLDPAATTPAAAIVQPAAALPPS